MLLPFKKAGEKSKTSSLRNQNVELEKYLFREMFENILNQKKKVHCTDNKDVETALCMGMAALDNIEILQKRLLIY